MLKKEWYHYRCTGAILLYYKMSGNINDKNVGNNVHKNPGQLHGKKESSDTRGIPSFEGCNDRDDD